jgi:hypothetical protein
MLAISSKLFLIGTNGTRGRFDQSPAIRIFAGPLDEWGHGLFGFVKATGEQFP